MSEIDKIVEEVNGSMAIEGMPLTDEDKERIRISLTDRKKFEATLNERIINNVK